MKSHQKEDAVSIFKFFGILKGKDKCMLIVGWIFAMLSGALMPTLALFFGQLTGNFKDGAKDPDQMMLEMLK